VSSPRKRERSEPVSSEQKEWRARSALLAVPGGYQPIDFKMATATGPGVRIVSPSPMA
jgi:hypothetical protein